MPDAQPLSGAVSDEALSLPRSPSPPARAPFPLLAVLAPLLGAGVLYLVTRSPLMLAFAALSPVIAVASAVDGRISARRRRRRDARAYDAAAAEFLERVAAAHQRELAALDARLPTASRILSDTSLRPRRWASPGDVFVPVRLGSGLRRSALSVSGAQETERERELHAVARTLREAPVAIDPSLGIGVVGPLPVARAMVRGMAVQLAHAHSPGILAIAAPPGDDYDWLDDYPHAAVADREGLRLRVIDDGANLRTDGTEPEDVHTASRQGETSGVLHAVLAVAEHVDDLPAGCRMVVRATASGACEVLAAPHDAMEVGASLHAELITAQSAAVFGRDLARAALSRGVAAARALPEHVDFDELGRGELQTNMSAGRGGIDRPGLSATVGVSSAGPLTLDLVASGPHAIVTGTTGSGKSELLLSWALAMASGRRPDEIVLLLVDFKGGTAFRRLAALPHTVGIVTDLAHGEADRALKSLRAELRRREAVLSELGVGDIRDAGARLPRLVIVVDEAAAMLAAFPDLAPLLSDIAARGRALGVHLVLGTQRATGVFGDALLANCALRLSLRLAAASDSTALLGTDAAARLPHSVPGRFVVQCDGRLFTAQAATTRARDVERVAAAYATAPRPPAPWLPALPPRIPLDAFGPAPGGGVVIGALDDPDRQAQEGIVFRPQRSHLLVLGVRGAGRTSALRAVLTQWHAEKIVVPPDVEGAWDALEAVGERAHEKSTPCLVAVDDVDALVARFDDDHRDAVLERLRSLLVDGPRASIAVVCSAVSLPTGLRPVAAQFGERLLLRCADRQEHVLAGAPAELFEADAPPGRGVWHGRAAQVVFIEPSSSDEIGRAEHGEKRPNGYVAGGEQSPPALSFSSGSVTAVVSVSPARTIRRLREACPGLEVIDLESGVKSYEDDPLRRLDPGAVAERGASPDDPGDGDIAIRSGGAALVGGADAWQTHWALLNRLRGRSRIVFDGCAPAQVRAVLRSRVVPPPVVLGHLLTCDPSGVFGRASMPEP